MDDFRLTSKHIDALKVLHRAERDKRLADRLKALIHLGSGWTVSEVSKALLVDEKTIYNWYNTYNQDGKTELLTLNYQGKASSLTDKQEEELGKHLDKNLYHNSNAIRQYIKKKYRVEYSPSGVKDLLKRLGFVFKKAKHIPGKLDPVAQKAFLAKYRRLRRTQGENDPCYFCDACHPQHNSIPAYGWIRRGNDKYVKSTGSRKRVNIHGALNIDTVAIVTDFAKSINGASSLRLFKKLEKKHPDAEVIHVIVDNASYYISQWLTEKLKGTKIKLHFLPGYSPNLNIIERLWRFFKKEILYNQYYEKFEDFVSACKGFFRCRTKYAEKLRSMLTENFQIFKTN